MTPKHLAGRAWCSPGQKRQEAWVCSFWAHPGGHTQQTLDLRGWNSGTKPSWKPRFESDENTGDIEATGLDEMVQKEMQNEKRVKDGAQGSNM